MATINKELENSAPFDANGAPSEVKKVLYIPEEGKTPTLHQLAIVLGLPVVRLQSAQVAYKPVEGKPYKAGEINWANISAFIDRRLAKTGYSTVEDVYNAALSTEYVAKRATRTADPNSVWGKVLFGTTPVRKGNVKVNDVITNKKTDKQFKVVFVTPTIVCYEPIATESDDASETVDKFIITEAIGNRMFNMKFNVVKDDK